MIGLRVDKIKRDGSNGQLKENLWMPTKNAMLKRKRKVMLTTSPSSFAYFEEALKSKSSFIWMWRAFLAFFVLCTVLSVVNILRDARSKQKYYVTTSMKDYSEGILDDPLFPIYPQVTVCRKPAWMSGENETRDTFIRYLYLALGYPFASITRQEFFEVLNVSIYLNQQAAELDEKLSFLHVLRSSEDEFIRLISETENFSLSELIFHNSISCEEMFLECFLTFIPYNCCSLFHPVLTSSGPCFALDFEESDLRGIVEEISASKPFNFIMSMRSPSSSKWKTEEGFLVFQSHPLEESQFADSGEAILVPPGSTTVIQSRLTLTNRFAKYLTWTTLSRNCPTLPTFIEQNETLRDRFTRDSCFMNFVAVNTRKVCNCDWILAKPSEFDIPRNICGPSQMLQCFLKAAEILAEDYVGETCDSPCVEYNFEATASYAGYGAPNETRVILRFARNEYVFREYQRNSITSFLSQIGGAMGLYLGASIITVIQALISLFLWIWHHLKQKKKVRTANSSLW